MNLIPFGINHIRAEKIFTIKSENREECPFLVAKTKEQELFWKFQSEKERNEALQTYKQHFEKVNIVFVPFADLFLNAGFIDFLFKADVEKTIKNEEEKDVVVSTKHCIKVVCGEDFFTAQYSSEGARDDAFDSYVDLLSEKGVV